MHPQRIIDMYIQHLRVHTWGVVTARLEQWRPVVGPAVPNAQHNNDGTQQGRTLPHPGTALSTPGLHAPTTYHLHVHEWFGHACRGCCLCKIGAMAACRWASTAQRTTHRGWPCINGALLALPGRRLDLPWPPQAPNINFLHSLILLARMQGVLPLAHWVLWGKDVLGCLGRLPNCQHKTPPDPLADHAKHPRSSLRPGLPSRHSQISPLCALHAELGEGTLLMPSGGCHCGRLPLGPYKTG